MSAVHRASSKGVPESDEVRRHRQDLEACELANCRRIPVRSRDRRRALKDTFSVAAGVAFFALVVMLLATTGDLAAVFAS